MGMFGGKTTKEGLVSTIAISGDRMMTVNDQTGELVDLAEEKVYSIDFKGKSYKVKTFAEMRKEWEEAQAKMKKQAAETKEEPEQKGDVEYEIDFSVEKTGQRKTVGRLRLPAGRHDDRRAPEGQEARGRRRHGDDHRHVDGADDSRDAGAGAFTQRYMKKLFGNDTETMARDLAQAMAMYPQMKGGHGADEEGSPSSSRAPPVLTTMKIEMVTSPEQAKAQAEGGESAEGGAGRHRRRPRRDVRQEEEGRRGAEGGPARRRRPEEPRPRS